MHDWQLRLLRKGRNEKAIKVLDYCMETFPIEKLGYDMYIPGIITGYVAAGDTIRPLLLPGISVTIILKNSIIT